MILGSLIFLELIKYRKEYNMFYITTKINPTNTQLSIDELLKDLWGEEETKTKAHVTMHDLSYLRTRTFHTSYDNIKVDRQVLSSLEYLADSTAKKMRMFLDTHKVNEMYSTFSIPKATGGHRVINAPNEELMTFMQEIKTALDRFNILPHDAAYAYIPSRDCKKAIERHQINKSNWFLKMDIKGFFDNCNRAFITKQLASLYPFCKMSSRIYADFVSTLIELVTLDDKLPQGTPLSPMLTNWLMVSVDHQITKMLSALPNVHIYTRYADDILISSRQQMSVSEMTSEIEHILKYFNEGFELKKSKTRYGSSAGRNWNLGIMYNKDNNLTVGHKRKHMIKTALHKFIITPDGRNLQWALQLNGELSYIRNIEPEYFKGLINFINKKYNINIIKEIKLIIKQQ